MLWRPQLRSVSAVQSSALAHRTPLCPPVLLLTYEHLPDGIWLSAVLLFILWLLGRRWVRCWPRPPRLQGVTAHRHCKRSAFVLVALAVTCGSLLSGQHVSLGHLALLLVGRRMHLAFCWSGAFHRVPSRSLSLRVLALLTDDQDSSGLGRSG